MTQTAALRSLPIHLGRALTIVLVSIAAVALVALAFGVGRWTADTGSTSSITHSAPALVSPVVPAIECHAVAQPC